MYTLGFLFGAGAEISYGLPTGGRFALDIFRHDSSRSKDKFRKMRAGIDRTTNYASKWLPDDYSSKNISSYGKTVFESIIKDTIEHNRYSIIDKLNGFDSFAIKAKERIIGEHGRDVDVAVKNILGRSVNNCYLNQSVAFVDTFKEGDKLFGNQYFSALILLCKKSKETENELLPTQVESELRKILVSIIQLHIGALSENLTRRINDNIFSKKDEEIDLFDDLGDIIQLNYKATGLLGIEYLFDKSSADCSTDAGVILRFAQYIIEDVYASVLDYKSLIDSNWHYLYYPKSEWAKFCKISIFLLTVRDYILLESKNDGSRAQDGYYHELMQLFAQFSENVKPSVIATTNYNQLITTVLGREIVYMNGSTELWYDPYLNRIGNQEKLNAGEKHFLVPLLFTQSGTKPMTSIDMSARYISTYNGWKDSDAIVSIGFGFNGDDEHINGIFRTLIEDNDKKLVVVTADSRSEQDIADKLKVTKTENISVIKVDDNRYHDGTPWGEYLIGNL